MLYMDKLNVQVGTAKILDGSATNSQIKQKFGSLDSHKVVDNHITDLTVSTYYSANTTTSVYVNLKAKIGGVCVHLTVTGGDFFELLKHDNLLEGVFQGEYFLIINGSTYKVIKSTDESIAKYKKQVEGIKAQEVDTKQKVKGLKQQFKKYKNPTLLKINERTYGIYLGNLPHWTYVKGEFNKNNKKHLMLTYTISDSSKLGGYSLQAFDLMLLDIRWEMINKVEFVHEYTWEDVYDLLAFKTGFTIDDDGKWTFDSSKHDSNYHKSRPIYLYTLLSKDLTTLDEARNLYDSMGLDSYIKEFCSGRGDINSHIVRDFVPRMLNKQLELH